MKTNIKHALEHQELVAIYRVLEGVTPFQNSNMNIMFGYLLNRVKIALKTKLVEEKSRYKLQINLAEAVALNDFLNAQNFGENAWFNSLVQRLINNNDKFIVQFKQNIPQNQIP